MEKEEIKQSKGRMRAAVWGCFLAQGLCFSSWASRIPDVKATFAIEDVFYWGLVLFLIPVGKFVAIPLAGYLVSRLGSRTMVQASVVGYALSLFAIGAVSSIYALGACLFSFGVFWNLCDISLNTQGIVIERSCDVCFQRVDHRGILPSSSDVWNQIALHGYRFQNNGTDWGTGES